MLENLKLPLCPKCGDTKNVNDKIVDESKLVLHTTYECKVCDISWTPYKIIDNNTNVEYKCHYPRGGTTLRSSDMHWTNPLKWWRTLTEDIKRD